ncbi:hypothetical protein LP420_12210 [Massilia sp. B-10]|nr:hypothetical protein LP420_12210 [Massilia sp. B-10]
MPGLNRAVRECAVLVWVVTMLALAPLAWSHPDGAMLFPQFALSLTGFRAVPGKPPRRFRGPGRDRPALPVRIGYSAADDVPDPSGRRRAGLAAGHRLCRVGAAAAPSRWCMNATGTCAPSKNTRAQNDLVEWGKGQARSRPPHAAVCVVAGARQPPERQSGRATVAWPRTAKSPLLCRCPDGLLRAGPAAGQWRAGAARSLGGRSSQDCLSTLAAVNGVVLMSMTWARYAFSLRSTAGEQAVLRLAASAAADTRAQSRAG